MRPNVKCVFDIMDECAMIGDESQKSACVEGARDSHLQTQLPKGYNDPKCDESYVIGWNSAVTNCPLEISYS